MTDDRAPVNRPLVGILALVCCGVGAALWFGWPDQDAFAAGFLRAGLLLGAVWLALPSRSRPAAWANMSPAALVVVFLAVVLVRQFRVLIPLLIVVCVAAIVLRPRPKRTGRRGGGEG